MRTMTSDDCARSASCTKRDESACWWAVSEEFFLLHNEFILGVYKKLPPPQTAEV